MIDFIDVCLTPLGGNCTRLHAVLVDDDSLPRTILLSDLRSPQFVMQKRCNWTLKANFFVWLNKIAESLFLLTYEYVQNDTAVSMLYSKDRLHQRRLKLTVG